jgi:serine/threonine protein phosphatase 1
MTPARTKDQPHVYAIGDVHGCAEALVKLLKKIKADPEIDTFVFIGDYLDRGPDPKGVVDAIVDLKQKFPRVICLKGNHEGLFLDYLAGDNENMFLYNGGSSTLESYGAVYGEPFPMPPEHQNFFDGLLLHHRIGDVLFVHAGIRPGVPLKDQTEHDLLWIREEFIYVPQREADLVVFGHTPSRRPIVYPDKIGIDTGAVYGNKLTCLKLPEREFVQVNS